MSIEQLFAAFFPSLNEENWREEGAKKVWPLETAPYLLKLENTAGYGQDCHFCNSHTCRQSCPLPFSSKTTVLDLLHKLGVEDNISFYEGKGGKADVILQLHLHQSWEKVFQRHLSSVLEATAAANS